MRGKSLAAIVGFAMLGTNLISASAASVPGQNDPKAVELAERTMEAMGGLDAWNNTRYISWNFFGRGRTHVWDKWTGNHRIEFSRDGDSFVSLINTNDWNGRVYKNGVEITDPEALAAALNSAQGAWINDSYWMFMPYKLLDPGVILKYLGEKKMEDGRDAEVVQLTFDNVGNTPQNKYEVFVAEDTGLVEQWTHWTNADDPEPRFTNPWAGWERFGNIMLATSKGRDADWQIHVYETLPDSVFTSPAPFER